MGYAKHMETNIEKVFSERDPALRIYAIRQIYTETADLYETYSSAKGHDSINDAVTELLIQIPAEFTFSIVRPALVLNHIARLQWRLSRSDGVVVATGTDVAHFEGEKIRALYVFVDQKGI
jgi:hypothetical protein